MSIRPTFSEFVERREPGLRHALMAELGFEIGRDAAAQALLYGLENWERVSAMENPAGYLYRMGQRWGRRQRRGSVAFGEVASSPDHWFEPGLESALRDLPVKQRMAVVLRHGLDLSYRDIASLTSQSETAVRKSVQRALARLRQALEVEDE